MRRPTAGQALVRMTSAGIEEVNVIEPGFADRGNACHWHGFAPARGCWERTLSTLHRLRHSSDDAVKLHSGEAVARAALIDGERHHTRRSTRQTEMNPRSEFVDQLIDA